MDNFEDLVKEHDENLYDAIKSYVNLMPDFRSQKTQERFKKEPQNHWRLIYNELYALSYDREEYQILVNMVNNNEAKKISQYIHRYPEIVSDFVFSYPALVWLMTRVSEREAIIPIIVSQGFYLKGMNLRLKDARHIQDVKTAKLFNSLCPFSEEERKELEKELEWRIMYPGELYLWYFGCSITFNEYPLQENKEKMLIDIVVGGYWKVLDYIMKKRPHLFTNKNFVDLIDWSTMNWRNSKIPPIVLSESINKSNQEKVLRNIIENPNFDPSYSDDAWKVLGFGFLYLLIRYSLNNVLIELLHDEKFLFDDINPGILGRAIRFNNIKGLLILLEDERFSHISRDHALVESINHKNYSIMKYLLDEGKITINSLQQVIPQLINDKALVPIRMILSPIYDFHHRLDLNYQNGNYLYWAIVNNDIDITKLLLDQQNIDPSIEDNAMLFAAIRELHIKNQRYEHILDLILSDPRMDISVGDNKLLRWSIEHNIRKLFDKLIQRDDLRPSYPNNLPFFEELDKGLFYKREKRDSSILFALAGHHNFDANWADGYRTPLISIIEGRRYPIAAHGEVDMDLYRELAEVILEKPFVNVDNALTLAEEIGDEEMVDLLRDYKIYEESLANA